MARRQAPTQTIFPTDNCFRQVVPLSTLPNSPPLVLNDPGPQRLTIRIVNGGVSLGVQPVEYLSLKTNRTIFEVPMAIVEVCVDWSCVNDFLRLAVPVHFVLNNLIHLNLNTFKHPSDHLCIAANGNTPSKWH